MKQGYEKRKVLYLVLSVVLCSLAMCWVDGVLMPGYFVKSLMKVLLFLLIPGVYFLVNRSEAGELRTLFLPKGRDLVKAFLLAIPLYAVIVGGYFLLRGSFDFSGIAGKLTENTGVSAENFLPVALYISFANSLLEEIFFLGFAFILLKKNAPRAFAYVFSAAFFAIYHGGMLLGYYHPGILLLVLGALFGAGLLFNFLNEKSGNIYPSWLVHMSANFAINTVGCLLFRIIP